MGLITNISIYIVGIIMVGCGIYNYVEYHSHIWYKQFGRQMSR